jgi:hypothetical protein
MINQSGRRKLRNILAKLYASQSSQHRVVKDAELNSKNIDYSGSPIDVWESITTEAAKNGEIDKLLFPVLEDYANNSELMDAVLELKVVVIKFLVAAMTYDEAITLFNKTAFIGSQDSLKQQEAFQNFLNSSTTEKFPNLQEYYGQSREDWRPHYCGGSSIEQIIVDTITFLNKRNNYLFVPKFVSSPFFSTNEEEHVQARNLLESVGVLVIDAISMYHPWLQQRIKDAYTIHKRSAILVVSPFNAPEKGINQLIEAAFKNVQEAYERFNTTHDHLCEIDFGDDRSLRRWFCHAIPDVVKLNHSYAPAPRSENRDSLIEILPNKERHGIESLLRGRL